jgi:hypothetical protein
VAQDRKTKEYRIWLSEHCGKVTFRSRAHAWRVIIKMFLREPGADRLYLSPYECRREASRPSRGIWVPQRNAAPHIHIGHSQHAPYPRLRGKLRHKVKYPLYRARLELKIRLGLAQRPPERKRRKK